MERAFFEAESDSLSYLHRQLPDENVPEATKDYILSEEKIRDAIRSEDELSACSNHGISNRIMKTGGSEAAKFMRYIIKATIRCGRVMYSWKEARIILIYRKEIART
jgi:hypothetical protein